MIKRSHVRHFLAVTEAGSFTHAASRIRVTQPTLSLGIKELERLVKARLFIRERGRVRLTDAGARFLPIARNLESTFREADGFANTEASDWPQLKLGVMRSVSGTVLECVVAVLADKFSIELLEGTESEMRAALSNGRTNLVLGRIEHNTETGCTFPLLDEPFVMLVSRSHRLAQQVSTVPEDLASEIMIARRSCELLDDTSRFFTRHQVRPRFALRSEIDDRCIRMVATGLGITTAPLSLANLNTAPVIVTGYEFRRRIGLQCDRQWMQQHQAMLHEAIKVLATDLPERLRLAVPARISLVEEGGNPFCRIDVHNVV